ncbi:hypothetical protein GCM10022239_19160 [Leifsonia bigeumensis]|uniref:Uncharacterized protein n=1 Tax=Leifsonella bigeumensis TaxID=433643 RepID=A0ABP7FNK8_9MICO
MMTRERDQRFDVVAGLNPRPLWVDKRRYDIPATSRAVFPSGERLAYLLDAAGRVYVLTESGDVECPPELAERLRAEFFPDSPG